MRCDYHERHLRPGGTISGPTMMALADLALYVAILAQIGPVGLAVTTSLNYNFLRKPGPVALIAEARLLKLGKRLAVGEVGLFSQGETEMVCVVPDTIGVVVVPLGPAYHWYVRFVPVALTAMNADAPERMNRVGVTDVMAGG